MTPYARLSTRLTRRRSDTFLAEYQWREVGYEWTDKGPVYFNRVVPAAQPYRSA